MINPNDSRLLDLTAYDLILADADRSLQRSLINGLFNGDSPYSQQEQQESQVRINVNDLTAPLLGHNARSQYYNGLLNQERYFTAFTDSSLVSAHKRDIVCGVVTKQANKLLKDDQAYYRGQNDDIASLVLHGIAPGVWENKWTAIPRPISIADALLPTRTLLGFSNLPFIYLRRDYTAMELEAVAKARKPDPGWNLDMVNRILEWLDREMTTLGNNVWPEAFKMEDWAELKKEGGMYMSDQVPVIATFDIYIHQEATKSQAAGWVRRIILDAWSSPGFTYSGSNVYVQKPTRKEARRDAHDEDILKPDKDAFLYTSGNRVVGKDWSNFVKFAFADLSAVSPKRYHSTRSLGWMAYSACHLKNRLYCKTMEAGFEALTQMFQVDNLDEAKQNSLVVQLSNFAVIDKTTKPVPAQERWQPNANLIELCLGLNSQLIDKNTQSWTASPTQQKKERETNFQRMADLQAMTSLVSAGLSMAYQDKRFEYMEIFRRLCQPNSRDPKVRRFREACFQQGVPEEVLNTPEAWDIQTEKMAGGGNQTLELIIAQEILQLLPKLEPEPQRIALRDAIMAMTKNPAKALQLVPENPVRVTSATHDAELAAGALMQAIPVEPLTGINVIEYTVQLIKILTAKIVQAKKMPMVDPKELMGMKNIGQNIEQHIKIIAQDPQQKGLVKQLTDLTGKLANELKALQQHMMEMFQKQAGQNGANGDPKDKAKVQGMLLSAAAKAKVTEAKGRQQLMQSEQRFQQELRHGQIKTAAELQAKDLETAGNIRLSMFDEPDTNAEQ